MTAQQNEKNLKTKPPIKRYGTYLPPETIKKLKIYAINSNKKDYDVVREAIEKYLTDNKIDS